MSDKMWFQPCTDEKHPRGPHLHLLDGVTIEVTDDRIVNAAFKARVAAVLRRITEMARDEDVEATRRLGRVAVWADEMLKECEA